MVHPIPCSLAHLLFSFCLLAYLFRVYGLYHRWGVTPKELSTLWGLSISCSIFSFFFYSVTNPLSQTSSFSGFLFEFLLVSPSVSLNCKQAMTEHSAILKRFQNYCSWAAGGIRSEHSLRALSVVS